ncbi:hypothetical protein ASZ78_013716 [Callipepla squamata]|uniref:NTR domain-containing protein n=1 Tax=Callipepla squamata TaxID=9009 RepID=A0A226MEF7_CALSU|nr:hypothetical protein ASZ78_013716 [Callipepla squamata]
MWSSILSAITLIWIVAASSELQYVLLVPTVVRSNSPQTACVQFHSVSEPLSLSVVLEYSNVQTTLFKEFVTKNDYFVCHEFKVPPHTSDPLAFISFSAKSNAVNLTERRLVAIENVHDTLFIQTDKPIYKPGQKVMFRVVTLDSQFRPVQETYPRIIVKDPEQNQIFQWLDVSSTHGIIQLSFPLIEEPILGSYHIIVEKKSGDEEHEYFTVEEYVLPKFEMTTNMPRRISFFDEEIRVNVCALGGEKQYGPTIKIFACDTAEGQGSLGNDGCLNTVVSTKTFQLYRSYTRMYASFNIETIITENGTGIQMKNSDYVAVSQENDRVMFRNMDQYYRRGIPYFGEITVTNADGKPVAGRVVVLEVNGEYQANYTTDENGTAAFSLDTSNFFNPSVKLRATQAPDDCEDLFMWRNDHESQALFFVRRFYSRTNSFVRIEPVREKVSCGQQKMINIYYVLSRNRYTNATHTDFYYVVMAKGQIVLSGQKQVRISHASAAPWGTFAITLAITEKLTPTSGLLLYTVHPDGEIVADSSWIHSDICFKNKLQLEFSEKQAFPGSKINIHLEAAANSCCALRAVDQSVFLLQRERELSAESVYYRFRLSDLYGYYHNGLNLQDDKPEECTPVKTTFFDGLYYEPVNVSHDGDVYRIFMITAAGVVNTVRKYFPETWIWDLVHTDSTGEANVFYTIPDTITEWKASAFCLQDVAGFGISSPVSLTAFQPFFVDLTLPYSVIRGEKFNVIANIFNYLNKCIQISATLAESCDYKTEVLSPEGNSATVCANERKTYIWSASPLSLGEVKFTVTAEAKLNTKAAKNSTSAEEEISHMDTLIQKLLVEPEGVKKELTQSSLICTKGTTVSEPVLLNLPRNAVQGSARAYFSVIGDILGTALRNMENLLHMPYGCGEQNMALFTPNIYVLDYLNKTGQLTEEIGVKGTGYLTTAEKEERYQYFLEKLERRATRVGGSVYWQRENKPPAENFPAFYSRAPSAEIEITSYALMALLNKAKLMPDDLSYISHIVYWLVKQQNPYGGFSSSQDTVVALQALAQYGYLTFSKESNNTIKVNFMEIPKKTFQVNDENRFLLQQTSLPIVPGNYSVEVYGTGCVYMQTTLRYNIHLPKKLAGFFLSVEPANVVCTSNFPPKFDLVFSASYTGNRNVSNMAIIDVKMLSGFIPNRSSLKKLQYQDSVVDHVDIKNDHIFFYLQKLSQTEVSFSFTLEQSLPVSDIKPAPVHVYDYYETGLVFFTFQLDTDGCLSQVLSSKIFELNRTGYRRNLDVKAIFTEKGTGLQLTATQSIYITQVISSLQFENVDHHYRRGIPYVGQILQKRRKEITFSVEQDFIEAHLKPAPVQIYDYYETEMLLQKWINESKGLIMEGVSFDLVRQYMVLLPFLVHTDSPEKVCIQLTHLNESVTLSATLEYQGENRSLIDDVVSEKDLFTCIPYSISKLNSTSVALLTVTVKGETLQFRRRKSVLVKNPESLVFVQTDKPIYKPGQTVLFRIVSLDKDFHPLNEKFPFVYVQDPQRNRVYQWQGVELETGLTQLSFPLTSDPIQGSYKIVVQKNFISHVEHSFTVEEYVLPKYEVLVKLPKMITIEDMEFPVSTCGLYTYGKPVPGLVNVQVCRKFSHSASHCYRKEGEAVCEEFTRQADARGCVSAVVRTKIFQLRRRGYEMSIEVQGKITEDGTGRCPIEVKLVDGNDSPIANETIRISVNGDLYKGNYTTDEQGQSWFSLNTTTFTEASLEIRAEYKPELNCYDSDWITPSYEHAMRRISRFYSPSKSFLKIEPKLEMLSCGSSTEIQVHYIFTPEAIEHQRKIVIYYLVMAKGSIMLADTHDLTVNPGNAYGIFQLTLPAEVNIAPLAQMLVYTTSPSGEVIASTAEFQVENCLPNKVNLSFVSEKSLPASNTSLKLHSSPRSLCALHAVDRSVLLMKPEEELSPSSVYDLLPVKELRGYSFKDYYLEEEDVNPCVSLDNILLNGFTYVPISPDGEADAYDIFKLLGLKVFTSNKIHKPEVCQHYTAHLMERSYGGSISASQLLDDSDYAVLEGMDAGNPVETIRKYFPETWIWDIVSVNLHETPLYNLQVSVSLAESTNFLAAPAEKEEESYCICLNERKTVAWSVTAKTLGLMEFLVSTEALQNQQPCGNATVMTPEKGQKDIVIRQLLVEFSCVLFLPEKSVSESVALALPENVVDGSARAYFLVLGDTMGAAMQNLHQLLEMPFGCGEQNMVLFAPNIYVLDYLNKTGQLSEEIKSKAIGYLVNGYQRQLKYKHWDGSYSTFGPHFGQVGNTWLTAFVLKSFARARSHIFIEEKHIQDALIWLSQKQKENGCFCSSGVLLNNAMKGGVNDEITLTAYITIALLEIPLPVTVRVT